MIPFFTFLAVITLIVIGYVGFTILQRRSRGPRYSEEQRRVLVNALEDALDNHRREREALGEAGFEVIDLTPVYTDLINQFK